MSIKIERKNYIQNFYDALNWDISDCLFYIGQVHLKLSIFKMGRKENYINNSYDVLNWDVADYSILVTYI